MPGGSPQPDPEALLTWAESRPPQRRRGLVWVARISPVLLCAFGVAQATDRLSWPVWLVFLFVNVVLWQMRGQRAYATLSRISSQEPSVRQYLPVSTCCRPPRLRQRGLRDCSRCCLRGRTFSGRPRPRPGAHRALHCPAQRTGVLGGADHLPVGCPGASGPGRLAGEGGPNLREWLEALGETEALAALAALAHANPGWAIWESIRPASRVEAQQAGHPLLARAPVSTTPSRWGRRGHSCS